MSLQTFIGKMRVMNADSMGHWFNGKLLASSRDEIITALELMAEALKRNANEMPEYSDRDSGHFCESKIRVKAISQRSKETLTKVDELFDKSRERVE